MRVLIEILCGFGLFAGSIVGFFGALILPWLAVASWKERNEVIRARRQGYRVKLFVGGHGSGGKRVQYTAGDIERNFDAYWEGRKLVVKLPSIPLSNLYSSEGSGDVMRDRVTLELKRLLRDKVEIIV